MKIENDFVTIELINGIIVGKYRDIFVTLEVAKSVLEARNEYTAKQAYPMVVDCSLLKGVDKSARDFFSLPSGSEGLKASAMVVKSRFNAFFVNFLLNVNLQKQSIPVKVFYNLEEAILWLEQYK
jgi:hypothetical protein